MPDFVENYRGHDIWFYPEGEYTQDVAYVVWKWPRAQSSLEACRRWIDANIANEEPDTDPDPVVIEDPDPVVIEDPDDDTLDDLDDIIIPDPDPDPDYQYDYYEGTWIYYSPTSECIIFWIQVITLNISFHSLMLSHT